MSQVINFGLNPCFNGICSARFDDWRESVRAYKVLILVLMEYALRELIQKADKRPAELS